MKKRKILFLGIAILFFMLVNFNYSYQSNKFNFSLLGMKAKAEEAPMMNLDINDGQIYVTTKVEVKGWALNNSGVKAVDLYVDGKFTKSLDCNFSTPDVYKQFPNYGNSASCGYDYQLSLSNGTHTIRTYDIGNDGKVIYKEVKIKVKDPNSTNIEINPSLKSKMDINTNNGQAYLSGSTIDLRGWAISGYGIKAVDLYVDGSYTKSMGCNLSRPDVESVFSQYPNADTSGYDYKFSLPDGIHTLRLYAISNDGTNIYQEIKVYVGNSYDTGIVINPSLQTKIGLEINDGQTYLSGNTIDVRGWAISGYGIKETDLYVDGKSAKTMYCNLSRPDVKNAFPQYPKAESSGYDYKLSLPDGAHTLKVYAISNDGTSIYKEATVYVNMKIKPSLQSKMNLEINNGQAFLDGNIDMRGWAISGYGINAIDLYVDGNYTKSLDCNLSRPDVDNAFPGYPNGSSSGYDYKLSLPYGTHKLRVYAISNNGTNIYQDAVIFVGPVNVQRKQSNIQIKLLDYLISSKENRDSVKSTAVYLHDGNASNTCVYFSSEALRRIGVKVPTYVANTYQYTNILSTYGWIKAYDYKSLIPGDICFTKNGSAGYPTHTYVFAGWVDDTYTTAYVIDNQNESYGDELHERVIPYDTSSFDKFQYFLYSLN